jgi:hypothetical protein
LPKMRPKRVRLKRTGSSMPSCARSSGGRSSMPVAGKQLLKRIDGLAGRGAACTGPRPSRRRRRGGRSPTIGRESAPCAASSRGLAAPACKIPAAPHGQRQHSFARRRLMRGQSRSSRLDVRRVLQVWRRCRVFRKGSRGGISGDVPDCKIVRRKHRRSRSARRPLADPQSSLDVGFGQPRTRARPTTSPLMTIATDFVFQRRANGCGW